MFKFRGHNRGPRCRQFLAAAWSWLVVLLLLVLVLPGNALRFGSDRDVCSNDLPQFDSFSEPAVAAVILQQQVRNLFQTYLLTNKPGAITARTSGTRAGPESEGQARKQPGVSADGRWNSARPYDQQSLWALDGRLRTLRSESLQNLLVIHCKNCSWNDFLDTYLELLAVAPDRAATRCWTREALTRSRTCGRTDEVLDALQHVTRFCKDTRVVAWIQGSLEDWNVGRSQGLAVEHGLAPERSSSSLLSIEGPRASTPPRPRTETYGLKSVNAKLTPRQVEELMVQNATAIGQGLLIPDAYRAVLAAGSKYTDANLETTTTQLLPPKPLREDLEFLFRTVEESHPNIYAHLTKDQYSQVRDEIRRRIAHPMSLSEFYIYVSRALSCIQDSHTRVERPDSFRMPPITESMRAFDDRLRQLLKNDAEPESDAPYLPAPRKEEYTSPLSPHLIPESNACLMVINSFGEPNEIQQYASRFRDAFKTLNEKKIAHLIVDLRENRGGCGLAADELLKYLARRPFRQFECVQQRIVPQFFALCEQWGLNVDSAMAEEYGIHLDEMKSRGTYKPGITVTGQVPFKQPHEPAKRFKGQIYFLIERPTFSTAANLAAAVKEFGIGTLLGQETSGQRDHFGQILPIQLPHSRLQCQVSTAHFVAVGGMQDRGGVKPDHEVKQTPDDNSKGIDTVLEYALALARTSDR
jgi:hypothetical protein